MKIKELLKEQKSQATVEYLYLTAFVIAIAAIAALLLQDIMTIQDQTRRKIDQYRDEVINKLVES